MWEDGGHADALERHLHGARDELKQVLLHITTHRFRDRIVGYRSDYGRACAAPRLALQHRSLYVLGVCFVPLIPIGFWRRWYCAVCGRDPHTNVYARRWIKWLGTAGLAYLAVLAWTSSAPSTSLEDLLFLWAVRAERLRLVQPIMDTACPLCGATLIPTEPAWKCPKCGATRLRPQTGW